MDKDCTFGNKTIEIWDGGAIRILIRIPNSYYMEAVFTGEQLKNLKKMVDYACKENNRKQRRRTKTPKRSRSSK